MHKKGIIRIIEAFVAVLLVAAVLLFVINKNSDVGSRNEEKIYELEKSILNEIAGQDQYRREILNNEISSNLRVFVDQKIPDNFNFDIKICNLEIVCPLDNFPENKNVYSKSVPITSNVTTYQPKQFRIFIWEK